MGLHVTLLMSPSADGVHCLTCAMMLLNTDLHGHVSMHSFVDSVLGGGGLLVAQSPCWWPAPKAPLQRANSEKAALPSCCPGQGFPACPGQSYVSWHCAWHCHNV